MFVFQIIIKQWDKSGQTPEHQVARSQRPSSLPLDRNNAFYAFNQQCVIDRHGDNVMANPIALRQLDENTVQIDKFRLSLSEKVLEYVGDAESRILACLDDNIIRCQYQWRYRVYEGGYYYWLYEQVTLNATYIANLDEFIFIDNEPKQIYSDLTIAAGSKS